MHFNVKFLHYSNNFLDFGPEDRIEERHKKYNRARVILGKRPDIFSL